jgi:hypothetical protein
LAQKLSMTVGEMRERLSGEEFTDWAMYYSRIGQRKQLADRRAGNG